jgi:sirohydrochlorin ferrochelatase
MIVALIDNGSLEPAAHLNLRSAAAALSERTGINVRAVSWKHSDRISAAALNDTPAWTLESFLRSMFALGQREFIFVPFFISAQGAIGSALRTDIETLRSSLGEFEFTFTDGLAARGSIPTIVADRIRATIMNHRLHTPPVIIVDHGGPSPVSAGLRNELAQKIAELLGSSVRQVTAASMEGESHAHNRPLLADVFAKPGYDHGPVVIAPLFLSPGRHAGPNGDLMRIAQSVETRLASPPLQCHFTELVGTHPLAIDSLSDALRHTLSTLHAPIFA